MSRTVARLGYKASEVLRRTWPLTPTFLGRSRFRQKRPSCDVPQVQAGLMDNVGVQLHLALGARGLWLPRALAALATAGIWKPA